MSPFVEKGIAAVMAIREDIANAHPADIVKALLEHIEEWCGEAVKTPPPAPAPAAIAESATKE